MTPAAVATPFPPLNPTNTENTCPRMAATPHAKGEQLGVGHLGSEDENRDGTLGDIDCGGWNRVFPAQDPIEVGGAEVPAAVLAKIDSGKESAEQIAGRYGPHKVGGEQPQDGLRHQRRDPRLVNFSRKGDPVNGQASRKPFARYR